MTHEQNQRFMEMHKQHLIVLTVFNIMYVMSILPPYEIGPAVFLFFLLLSVCLALFQYLVVIILPFLLIYQKRLK